MTDVPNADIDTGGNATCDHDWTHKDSSHYTWETVLFRFEENWRGKERMTEQRVNEYGRIDRFYCRKCLQQTERKRATRATLPDVPPSWFDQTAPCERLYSHNADVLFPRGERE